jgi:hypothetical protein
VDWAAAGAVVSAIIAIAALAFSFVVFRAQQRWAEKNAWANVRPFFWTRIQTYVDLKSIILRNDGMGPAVITSAIFTKGGKSTSRLVELFNLDIPYWETYAPISPGRVVPSQGEIVLIKQSLDHLRGQKIERTKGLAILEELQTQQSGIHLRIEFEDIYGNAIQAYERDL